MIVGSHVVIYSRDGAADRALLRDVLRLPHVDVGGGWLIFGLPASEVAFHPTDSAKSTEFYLMCADVRAFVAEMQKRALACTPLTEERWGILTHLTLPGGARIGVYEPRHARPKSAHAPAAGRKRAPKKRAPARPRRAAKARARRARPK
jgi:hypothetical protein